ncbi:battenin, partial [Cetorhinus maximus]
MEAPVILDPPSRGGSQQESSDEDDQPLMNRIPDRGKSWRNVGAFWLLGLCNNFSYVIMLSAAHDILSKQEGGNATVPIHTQRNARSGPIGGEVKSRASWAVGPESRVVQTRIPGPNATKGAEFGQELALMGGGEVNGTGRYDCNPISTAAILLADILPTLLIKLTAPFFIQHVPYGHSLSLSLQVSGDVLSSLSLSLSLSLTFPLSLPRFR